MRSTETLRALMHQAGLSTRGLALAAGVHHSFIDHLLSGRRETCGPTVTESIAGTLGAPPSVLFEPESDEPSEST